MALVDASTDPRIQRRENSVSAIETRLKSLERNKSNQKLKKKEQLWSETKEPKSELALKAIE